MPEHAEKVEKSPEFRQETVDRAKGACNRFNFSLLLSSCWMSKMDGLRALGTLFRY